MAVYRPCTRPVYSARLHDRPCTGRVHSGLRPYMARTRPSTRDVYTADTRPIHGRKCVHGPCTWQRKVSCTRPCSWPCTGGVTCRVAFTTRTRHVTPPFMGRVHGRYTAVYGPGRVRAVAVSAYVHLPCSRLCMDRVHGRLRLCTWRVHGPVHGTCTRPIQGRVPAVYMAVYCVRVQSRVLCTRPAYGRVYVRTCIRAVYTPCWGCLHGGKRPCIRLYTATSRVDCRVHGRVRAVSTGIHGRARTVHTARVYGPCTRLCTGHVHGRFLPCTWRVHGRVHGRPYTRLAVYTAMYSDRLGRVHSRVPACTRRAVYEAVYSVVYTKMTMYGPCNDRVHGVTNRTRS